MVKKLIALAVMCITFVHPQNAFAAQESQVPLELSDFCANQSSASLCVHTNSQNVEKGQKSVFLASSLQLPEKKKEANVQKEEKSGLNATLLFQMVNQQRQKFHLPFFEISENLCSLAKERAGEIYNEIFVTGQMHKGLYERNLPYRVTENIIAMRTEESALEWWLNSKVHRSAILGEYAYSCMACKDNTCTQVFSNYIPVD